MPIALSPDASFEYVLRAERRLAPEQQTVFELGVFSKEEEQRLAEFRTYNVGTGELDLKASLQRNELGLRMKLRGWKNWRYADGEPVVYQRGSDGLVPSATVLLLSMQDRTELFDAIQERAAVPLEK